MDQSPDSGSEADPEFAAAAALAGDSDGEANPEFLAAAAEGGAAELNVNNGDDDFSDDGEAHPDFVVAAGQQPGKHGQPGCPAGNRLNPLVSQGCWPGQPSNYSNIKFSLH